ncbi:dihydrodipicolinate synthase family protein [Pseudomonas syringae]|uniref:Dihydrodipicolinate synthase family protein n=2 Tax=Pseudomonas syringae TaxID=317 RepID=A0AAJ4E3J7_PSESX|nr:dihydrodipicolinate synthase family protein [Pseudomonas syringae]MCF5198684.1 dihydrodipicolinate synthase family protein [Pseudomonas syringae]MCF5208200.1 dihydrodipicolinate synthase family protein [Pseudomonas syringae]MCF5216294.1 dihydrodipicolinate synthase family protein [Pseudomonas syringae]MCF5221470.1 dihydrodipicolinate synthase family protein [Pseudomonas syringae]MCF5265887.1 dihydrodipicolinate synthase family protein [Pseudomonas syringae]
MSGKSILVPLITPLNAQEQVCEASLERLLGSLAPHVDGYIPCLTSGEGWRLSRQQWLQMLTLTLRHAGERSVIAGIERHSTQEVLDFALLAQDAGAQAVMFTSPLTPGISQQAIIEHYQTIHDATHMDIFMYNEAALSGNEKSFATLKAIAQLPRVIGLKDSPSLSRPQAQVDAIRQEGVDYFIGWEMQLAGDLESDGNVVSLANLEPLLCRTAAARQQPALSQEVATLNQRYLLNAPDWYAHIKRELRARGVINSERVVTEEAA